LPESWEIIEEWIDNSKDAIEIVQKEKESWKKKNLNIPILENYGVPPSESFWNFFPSHYPTEPKKTVNVENLKMYIRNCWPDWTLPQKRTAEKAVAFLESKKTRPFDHRFAGFARKECPLRH
jgi:hypothetical protein